MSDFDKWLHEQHVKQNDRKWAFNYVVKCILGVLIGLFLIKGCSSNNTPSKATPSPTEKATHQVTATPMPTTYAAENGDFSLDEEVTKSLIIAHFEGNGLTIKRVIGQPLVEKHPGLYGGMERWQVTFTNEKTILVWIVNGTIQYSYGSEYYKDIPLY